MSHPIGKSGPVVEPDRTVPVASATAVAREGVEHLVNHSLMAHETAVLIGTKMARQEKSHRERTQNRKLIAREVVEVYHVGYDLSKRKTL